MRYLPTDIANSKLFCEQLFHFKITKKPTHKKRETFQTQIKIVVWHINDCFNILMFNDIL